MYRRARNLLSHASLIPALPPLQTQEIVPALDADKPGGDKIWDWDIPYNELEFQGNPKNSMVELYPTVRHPLCPSPSLPLSSSPSLPLSLSLTPTPSFSLTHTPSYLSLLL